MSTIATVGIAKPAKVRSRWLAGVRRLKNLGLLAVVLLLWEVTSTLPSRQDDGGSVAAAVGYRPRRLGLIQSGELFIHLRDSLSREVVAFIWATSAIPLGIAMGWSKTINDQVDPLVEVLRPVPPLAWIPLSILWFGIGDMQNQFIIFLGMFFPILLNTIAGVKNIEPNLIRAARCLGASEPRILRRVVLRAALPQIITGIRVGLGVGWMALVAAELVGANSGLGFLINDARTLLAHRYCHRRHDHDRHRRPYHRSNDPRRRTADDALVARSRGLTSR